MPLPGYSPFYHSHTRRMITVFTSLFTGIRIARRQQDGTLEQIVTVPVNFSGHDKFYARKKLQEVDDGDLKSKGHPVFPRMETVLSDFNPDYARLNGKNERVIEQIDAQTARYMPGPVPYTFNFELWIVAKNFNDALQVVEQILPYFRPTLTVKIKGTPFIDNDSIPITLENVDFVDNYDDELATSTRRVIFTLYFTAKYGFAGPAGTAQEQEVKDAIYDEEGVPEEDRVPAGPLRKVINEVIIDTYTIEANFADSAESSYRTTVSSTDPEAEPETVIERNPTSGRTP